MGIRIVLVMVFCGLSCLTLARHSYPLTYKPEGKIIEFNYHGYKLYTDTNSFFSTHFNGNKALKNDIINYVRSHAAESDTVVIPSNIINFKENSDDLSNAWLVDFSIIDLIHNDLIMIFDLKKERAQQIITKKYGIRLFGGDVVRVYKIAKTNDAILEILIFPKKCRRRRSKRKI